MSSARVDLGLARLAILDLSPAGHQPMTLADGRLTITFNGEITNFIEIREELRTLGEDFESDGDTEVLLKGWSRWGVDVVHRLEGMFAFAVLDLASRSVTLVRDPFGIKPLFYSSAPDRFAFCSELGGIFELSGGMPRLDWQTAVDYLQWGTYDHSERTFIDGVHQLRPGHYAVIDIDTGLVEGPIRYWRPSISMTFDGSYSEATDIVRELFLDSVKRNLRSDVPVGIALSGGIDSSAIVGAVRHLDPDYPVTTFSYIAPGFARSEHEWVERVVEATRARAFSVEAGPHDLERDLDDLLRAQGEPFGGTSIYAQYRVFRLARENDVVVTLDGQGGDELFAGYAGYPAQRMHSLVETGHLAAAGRFVSGWRSWPDRSLPLMLAETAAQFFPMRVRHRVRQPLPSPLLDRRLLQERQIDLGFPVPAATGPRGRRLASHLWKTMTEYGLPALVRHADRNSMAVSVESRVPFLDRRLAEFTLSLPEPWLIGPDGTSKRILRDAVSDLVPPEIIQRRDKVGFETPELAWQERLGQLPNDREHPIPFLRDGRSPTLTAGLSEEEIRWGHRSHWRLINLKRWVSLTGVDAS